MYLRKFIGHALHDLHVTGMFTESNALLMSKSTATLSCGGLGLLKLFVIWWQMLCKAVCVECLCLNPC